MNVDSTRLALRLRRSRLCPGYPIPVSAPAWGRCKRSSPGDTPAHVLVSLPGHLIRGASDPPTCEPPALRGSHAYCASFCRACTFAAWRMCKRSSPGDTPAHVLVSLPGHLFVGQVTHPRVSHLHLRGSHAYSLFAARALLLRGGCASEAPQVTPQPACWLVFPGHLFVGQVTHPRVSHLHFRGSACLLTLCRACTFAAWRVLRARSLLLGRAGRQNGRGTHLLLVSAYLRRHLTLPL